MFSRRWIFIFILFLFLPSIALSTSDAGNKKGQKEIIDQIESNMVFIPAGEFLMGGQGAAIEIPQHKVYLGPFHIGKYEVTFEEYKEFCIETDRKMILTNCERGYQLPEGLFGKNKPVINVSRYDAEAYCEWLCRKTGDHYRLPTEAEWEKAARGGAESKEYPWGNEAPSADGIYRANYGPSLNHFVWGQDGYEYTAPVGSYPPNGYGLYDMAGNLWEWVQDRFSRDYYRKSQYKNPKGPDRGSQGIIRGGCYGSSLEHLRCAKRYPIHPTSAGQLTGFRIVRAP
jgi:sulfatase modifying factor 1